MNPHNYYTIFTRKSKSQKLVILSETQCSEVSKSHESKYYQINVPKANPKDNYANSPKVRDSLLIHESLKWILRLFQRLSMTTTLLCHTKRDSANYSNHTQPRHTKANQRIALPRHTEGFSPKYPNRATLNHSRINDSMANLKYNYIDSPKVSDSPLIHESPKWILRLFQRLSMTTTLLCHTKRNSAKYPNHTQPRHTEATKSPKYPNRAIQNKICRVATISTLIIFTSTNLANLNAVELGSIAGCASNQQCKITTNYDTITNSGNHTTGGNEGIEIEARIGTFINYGTITANNATQQTFTFRNGGYVGHFINYGSMYAINGATGASKMGLWVDSGNGISTVTNYGVMGSINYGANNNTISTPLTLNNFGLIGANNQHIFATNSSKVLIQYYTTMISETATTFNNFTQTRDNNFSHLVINTINNSSVTFKNKNSRILLDFGADFELGTEYSIDKVATNTNGQTYTALGVDFSRLSTRNDIYSLSQSGNNFVVSMNPQYGTMGTLYKSNVKTMSNLYLQSNNMIYPHKYKKKKFGSTNPNINPSAPNNYRRVRGISNLFRNPQSLGESYAYNNTNPLESHELFFYDNEWLLSRDNANARKVNMDYTHSVKAVNNSNVSKDAYYNKGAYRNKIITNDTRTNEINQYQSTNRQGNVSRTPNQNNRHLANQSNNSPCGSYKCIYIYKPQQQTKQIQPQPKIEPKVVEQPKIEPKIQPQPKPIQAIRPTMPPPPKVEPKIEPKPIVQPKEQPKPLPKVEQPKPEPKVVKVESKPTPPKPKVIIQDPYYFILTPYVAHNFFYESGRYNLSGLEYGFITAFSGKITEEHILGVHFAFSYGSLKDSVDTIFNITSMNIMGGLNYKFDMTNDMYLKARVDIFYFLNQVQSTMTSGTIMKPNNLGFGASVAYGKEWDFDKNGILGLEVALDYKGLMGNAFSFTSYANTTASYVDNYDKALYNMLYVDLGLNYDKYFESSVGKWGLDSGLGIRGNITANALAKSRVSAHNNARITNMTLDNDRFIAYLNLGGSYLLEKKDFDMEFSLAYYGNFGDRTISNAGGFEWRVYW